MKRFLRLVFAVAGFAALLSGPQPRATAQQLVPPAGEGTHLFRRIIYDSLFGHDLQPLQKMDQLKEDPEHTLLIVLGELNVFDRMPLPLSEFIAQGGAVLVATDRDANHVALRPFHVSVIGKPVKIDQESKYAYLGSEDCIIVEDRPAGAKVFKGLHRIATNRPGYLELGQDGPPIWAAFPKGVQVEGVRSSPFWTFPFAAGDTLEQGRILFLSDHSVFINAMLWQTDNDNLAFAYNCIAWLTDSGKRNRVLFLEEGVVQDRFDIPLMETRTLVPPLEKIVRAVDEGLRGMEKENRFNEVIYNVFDSVDPEMVLKGLLIVASLGLGVFGLIRLSMAKHQWETGTPPLDSALVQLLPAVPLVAQRQRTMLREGNFWEAARGLARQGFAAVLSASPNDSNGRLPLLRMDGSWWQRYSMRRRVKKLWRLAYGTHARPISAAEWEKLPGELAALKSAVAGGSLRLRRRDEQ